LFSVPSPELQALKIFSVAVKHVASVKNLNCTRRIIRAEHWVCINRVDEFRFHPDPFGSFAKLQKTPV
jgi:hypothetical protein